MVNRKTGKFSMEVKKTVDKGVPFSQTFLHFITTNQCEKLALKVLCGINIFRRAHFSLVFTYLKQDSCSTIINQTTVCPFIFIDFWNMSSSRLTMFSFLYDFPPRSRNGFWRWQMTTIIQTSRVLLSGRADHNHGHPIRPISVFVPNLLASQSSPSDDNKHPPKSRKEWGRGFAQAALCLCPRMGKTVQAHPKQPQFLIAFPTQNLRGSHQGWRRPVQRVTRFWIHHLTCYLLRPLSHLWFSWPSNPAGGISFPPCASISAFLNGLLCCLSVTVLKVCLCLMVSFPMCTEYSKVACPC